MVLSGTLVTGSEECGESHWSRHTLQHSDVKLQSDLRGGTDATEVTVIQAALS